MYLDPPQITIYSRILDNITHQEIEGYSLLNKRSKINFGKINGLSGGESPVIVEFDIWNNEPAITGGITAHAVSDAESCRFTAWDDESCTHSNNIENPENYVPYVQARCVMESQHEHFQPIGGSRYLSSNKIYSNVSKASGVLSGQPGGDHTKIQTKIVIPLDTPSSVKNFVFEFSYTYV